MTEETYNRATNLRNIIEKEKKVLKYWKEDGSITIILNSIEEVEEFVECVNIWNRMCEDEE